ncbi:hypothetical protein [Gymnodinialimonas hymeniacidonis]|uniref:hypothetical protein n=1 Tax=Gymnodinialimonas hymeniacidonis TaxID=3126508 RepID=UPI0034C6DB2E
MRIFRIPLLLGPAALLAASMAHGQAATPEDHPGYPLAQAIAAQGCVLHQDDVNAVMDSIGVESAMFPQMAVPLMQTGFLRSSGNGTLTLVNWGLCTGDVPAQAGEEAEATPDESETETE